MTRYQPPPDDNTDETIWAAAVLTGIHSRGLGAIANLNDTDHAMWQKATRIHRDAWTAHVHRTRAAYHKAIDDAAHQVGANGRPT